MRHLLPSFLLLCFSFGRLTASEQPSVGQNTYLSQLVEQGVLTTADLTDADLAEQAKVDGARTASALGKIARMLEPATEDSAALSTLTVRGIIGSVEYWRKNAVAGRTCDGPKIAILVERAASRLPTPPPASTKAIPLEPAAFADLKDSYDIVIAGAGTGGCGAAVQAARMGRTVLLIEETDWIGGQMNAAAVTSMDEGLAIVRERGLYRELCGLIKAHYDPLGINSETAYWHRHPCVEPRIGQQLLLKMLSDARGLNGRLDLVLRTQVTRTIKTGQMIEGVVASDGANARSIRSHILIDATEWGDVIPLTGARYRSGMTTSDSLDGSKAIQDLSWTAVV
jgi:hypothetical protein